MKASTRLARIPRSNPAAEPKASNLNARPNAACNTSLRCAPRAIRIPNSFSRLLTECASDSKDASYRQRRAHRAQHTQRHRYHTRSKQSSVHRFGQWRETDDSGKRVMRTVKLGDYHIPNRESARIALDAYLSSKLPQGELDDKPMGKKGVYRVIVAAAKRAGVAGIHPHILRHSCATHCLNRGMDIRHVQELVVHTSLIATQKYLHVATANLQATHA